MLVMCNRCMGNGELVINWDDYLHPPSREAEEKSVADCPDCDGVGEIEEK